MVVVATAESPAPSPNDGYVVVEIPERSIGEEVNPATLPGSTVSGISVMVLVLVSYKWISIFVFDGVLVLIVALPHFCKYGGETATERADPKRELGANVSAPPETTVLVVVDS